MTWTDLALEFEDLAVVGDANVEWRFDAKRGAHHQWLVSDDRNWVLLPNLWDLFARAGDLLPTEGAPRSIFPTKLLGEPLPERRWLSAIRHVKINVIHGEGEGFRTDSGMIYSAAVASAELCRRLATSPRFPKVGSGPAARWEDVNPSRDRDETAEQLASVR